MPSQGQGLNFGGTFTQVPRAVPFAPSHLAMRASACVRKWIGLSYLSVVTSTCTSKVELKSSHFLCLPHTRFEEVERTSIFKHDCLHFHKQGGTKEFSLSRELSLSSSH